MELFPEQGSWSEQQYLGLKTNRLVEFDNGVIEVLPAATKSHQIVVLSVYELLKAYITRRDGPRGVVIVAAYPLRIPSGRYREPDLLYLTPEQNAAAAEEFTTAAALVVEVVNPADPNRDYVTKRADYAQAGVPEYWIVDRQRHEILVLRLDNGQYVQHGVFGAGQRATSVRLPGFVVDVNTVMSQD